ncbi:hypothetical protein JL193_08070 [Polaribacter batillariae]|uniref:Uncharacterized protein n=1 Tax=Polaribacter batillariae TaxID=2808900 RepID=A0ABX7SY66_9FLAO|nr:hypothetical protein [Polaribacter batillariae]QTD39182.1 hypothetical protein JL193_08070 [Polaribacter batillariae]
MSTRIEYRDINVIITEQQASLSNMYYKIYYDDNDIRLRKELFYKGNLHSITYYLKPGDNEEQLVEQLMQQIDRVSIIESTIVEPYFVEREYKKGIGLMYEGDYVWPENLHYLLYNYNFFSYREVKNRKGEIVPSRKVKKFEYDGFQEYTFFYNEDDSFASCSLKITGGFAKDEYIGFNSFTEIEFPPENEMPIKAAYFETGNPDPTGFEIT